VNLRLLFLTSTLKQTHLFPIILQQHLLALYLLLILLFLLLHLSNYHNLGVLLVFLSELHFLLLSTQNHKICPLLILCLRFFNSLLKFLQLSLMGLF
jgi:hypothetical protein